MPVGLFRIELIDYSECVPVELKIKWDGTAPGLAEKRLSVAAFGDALTLLLAGLRRIATNIVGDAFEEKTSKGRFANAARRLDIEITELLKESSGFDSVVTFATPVGDTFPLLNLAEIAAEQLLDALDSESRGIAKNANVRRYLKALPAGITQQTYSLHQNGTLLRQVSFGEALLPEIPAELPYIARYLGNIVGVGFEPGRTEVRLRTEERNLTLVATPAQVDRALNLRHLKVRAVAVVEDNLERLLMIQDAESPVNRSTRELAIYQRWEEALRRLAQ